ncbi:uncharacterized protein YuzB (UPF0349 family) [Natranaerovirga pectinivora]|uniref:Uncharacterized protein YuzB (UPF0349 family) n=1 Tax=Natranaerovirga pectinivora TaxID=682400 RepID=A0A4R3MP21_9FIRM|nr:DUF1450 domain-containing protein [Natranaerovirga pectinivora]TCT16310.1 uncharacterized protein YuzB (UPF0349 family) [Natranaerovirga pectinivora]
MEIFFCENNVSKGLESVVQKIEENTTDVEVVVEPCLGHCTDCEETFFATVDVEIIYGDTPNELYEKIMSYYNESIDELEY